MDDALDKIVQEISQNHHKIIDYWCKAYLAQLYQEGHDIKPGNFTLNEQVPTYHLGKDCMVKKYWFEPGIPKFDDGWINCSEKLPEEGQELLMTYNDFVMEGKFVNGKFYHPYDDDRQEGITHWMPLPEAPKDEE